MGRGQRAEEVGWQRGFGGRGGLEGAMMGRGSDGQGERWAEGAMNRGSDEQR